jgi:cytochrome P450
MRDFETLDIITDEAVQQDFRPYFEYLRSKCPVAKEPHHGMMIVTGHQPTVEVYQQGDTFTHCQMVGGPTVPLPFKVEGDDITAQVKEHRHKMPWATHFITMDEPDHMPRRTILTRMMTHKLMKKKKDYMEEVADRLIDRFIERGSCDVVFEYTQELGTLVICDMLGVPLEDRQALVDAIGPPPGMVDNTLPENKKHADPLKWLDDRFKPYLTERRKNPQNDILTEFAEARFPDGTLPSLDEIVRIATFTFVAGQDTSVKMMTWAFKFLCDHPELQERLHDEPNRISDFIEETLRMEAPTKISSRTTQKTTIIGGVKVPAGTFMALAMAAANRDPEVFPDPDKFDIDRPNVREHLSFARGSQACPGAPLARLEGQVSVARFLARLKNLRINEAKHGPPDARHFYRQPTFVLNGLEELHIEFDKR